MAKILVTGGAGFIGSHTCLVLLLAGHEVVVVDSFVNSSPDSLQRVVDIAAEERADCRLCTIKGDIRDPIFLDGIFQPASGSPRQFDAVIHFAGLKSVAESTLNPIEYWDVNVSGSLNLLSAMARSGCRTIVFSSSATVYGVPLKTPITEDQTVSPVNPYGYTKAAVETILAGVSASEPGWRIASLRYFNPVGAHHSGRIGEAPQGTPNNLFPYLTQVAVGRRSHLNVFGGDWPTPDGTGIRDYIHVMDLAEGHLAALYALFAGDDRMLTLNLGTGEGSSVLEVIRMFEKVTGCRIPYRLTDRRSGDVPVTVADPSYAREILGWRAARTLADICTDGWLWQRNNPSGYV